MRTMMNTLKVKREMAKGRRICSHLLSLMRSPVEAAGSTLRPFSLRTKLPVIFGLLIVLAGYSTAEPGSTTAAFLQIPVGARAVAMGGAYTALATDAYAMHYNPAGLGLAPHEITFTHNEYVLDLQQEYVAYSVPLKVGAIGASVNYFDLGKFDRTVIVGPVANPNNFASRGSFSASNLAVSMGYGRQIFVEGFHLGIAGKYIRQDIDNYDGFTAAVDLGAYYQKPGSPLSFGVSVLNLGDKIKMNSRYDELPLTVRVGGAFRIIPERLLITADLEKTERDNNYYGHAGAEFWVSPMLALRAGWDGTTDAGNGLRAGIGIKYDEISLDYAWGDEDELKQTHRISVGYRF